MTTSDDFSYDPAAPAEAAEKRPGWRRKRVLIPAVLVALIAFGSAGGDDKQSSEALLSVTNAGDSKAKAASEQAARDLAAAEPGSTAAVVMLRGS